MSHFAPVALPHANRLINHGPTVLITSVFGAKRNVMAAAWSMPVEFSPPRVAVVIDKSTFSRELMTAHGGFGLCVPATAAMDLTYAVGSCSGRERDKFAHYNIQAAPGPALGVPIIEANCLAWMECRLIREPHTEDAYDTCFAEVVSAAADSRVFANGHWTLNDGNATLRSIHHLGGGLFAPAGEAVQARPLPPTRPG
ncbi:MAG: flavin reductase family protein [Hydrogenophaga sp.]|uniref:flavin reductase family protein n=1 Tax=Hydrogenophaga sp. TaxID=1904254 RepID=UPI0027335BDC|nr:flavin reductase family protein [Hydrogenophaga sp.]MDP3626304.1 flavin reductase family protein [Hydrogenophaga sp.]